MQTIRKVWMGMVVSATLLGGCDDPPAQRAVPTFEAPEGGTVSGDASVADGSLTEGGAIAVSPRVGPVFAAVSSDWSASAISLLDARGELLADDYLTSGSTRTGLVSALSGDVDLPRASGEPGVLVVLDRFKADVITRIRLSDGAILGQLKTHTPSTQSSTDAFTSNPRDYLYLDPSTAWVSRAQPNLDPSAPAIDRGSDLLRIDPTTMQRTSERIDLSVLDGTATIADLMGGGSKQVVLHARPGRMARVGDVAVVGTTRTSYDYEAIGDGMVAIVDLRTKSVTGFALEGLKFCDDVQNVPGDDNSVLVACSGDRGAPDVRQTSGLALVGVNGGVATLEQVFYVRDDADLLPLTSSVVALGSTWVGVGSNDYAGQSADRFVLLDLATKQKSTLLSFAPGSGRFGIPSYDSQSQLLLLPDASVGADKRPTAGLRRFQRGADGSFSELSLVQVSVQSGMPVRFVYPL